LCQKLEHKRIIILNGCPDRQVSITLEKDLLDRSFQRRRELFIRDQATRHPAQRLQVASDRLKWFAFWHLYPYESIPSIPAPIPQRFEELRDQRRREQVLLYAQCVNKSFFLAGPGIFMFGEKSIAAEVSIGQLEQLCNV